MSLPLNIERSLSQTSTITTSFQNLVNMEGVRCNFQDNQLLIKSHVELDNHSNAAQNCIS